MASGSRNEKDDMRHPPVAIDLSSTFVVVRPDLLADRIDVTETIWSDLDERYDNFRNHSLVSSFSFDTDWPTWERHPKGDEIVCLLSGDAEMILKTSDGDRRVRLDTPGTCVIVPQDTWHTARVHEPTTMLFITPGEGTENQASPDE